MDCGGTGGQIPRHTVQRKESRLRRAVTFFKHFGRKASTKGKIAWPAFSGKAREIADTSRYAPMDEKHSMENIQFAEIDVDAEVHEMPRHPADSFALWPELPSHISYSCPDNLDWKGYKQPPEASHPFEMPTRLSHTVQHEMPQPESGQELPMDKASPIGVQSMNMQARSPGDNDLLSINESNDLELPSSLSELESPIMKSPIASTIETAPNSYISIDALIDTPAPSVENHHFFMPSDLLPNSVYTNYHIAETSRADIHANSSITPGRLSSETNRAHIDVNTRPAKTRPICWLPEDRQQLWTAILTSTHHMEGNSRFSGIGEANAGDTTTSCRTSASATSLNDDPASMERIVQELRDFVCIFNIEWLQRLASDPQLSVICSTIPDRTLFELGINALKQCYDGTLVTTFVDIFALIHFACASAYYLYRDDDSYCWDDFLQNMLDWRHAITDDKEKLLFLRAVDKLSYPCGSFGVPWGEENDFTATAYPGNSLEVLKGGQIVKSCAMLLDGKLLHAPSTKTDG